MLTVIGDVAAGSARAARRRPRPGRPHHDRRPAAARRRGRRPRRVDRRRHWARARPTAMRARSAAPEGAAGEVRVHRPAAARAHSARPGSDVQAGDRRPRARARSSARRRSACSPRSAAAPSRVRPRPRVVVMSTGSELVQPGEAVGPRPDLRLQQLRPHRRRPRRRRHRLPRRRRRRRRRDPPLHHRGPAHPRRPRRHHAAASASARTTSSRRPCPSVGDEDEAGSGIDFRKLAMQPGKPQGFGLIGPDHTPLLALPGNPVSSYVSFELFVRPAIRALMGLTDVHRPTDRGARWTTDKALTSPGGRRQFLRGTYDADGRHGHPRRRRRLPPDRGPRARRRADRRPRGRRPSVEPGAEVDVVLLG